MPREDVRMTEADFHAFWEGVDWVALGTLSRRGDPVGTVASAVADKNWLFFAVPSGSEADTNLLHDPRCCCSADVFPSYHEIQGATVHGRARQVQPEPWLIETLERHSDRHGLMGGSVFTVPLLEDAFSFDFRKLRR
jgi:hypothetical protein